MEILRCFGKWVVFVVRRTKAVLNINIFPIWQRIHGLMQFRRRFPLNMNPFW